MHSFSNNGLEWPHSAYPVELVHDADTVNQTPQRQPLKGRENFMNLGRMCLTRR